MSRPKARSLGDRARNSSFIVGIYIAVLLLLGASLIGGWRDFITSLHGAELLRIPSMGGNPVIDELSLFFIAITPQVLTIVLTYTVLAIPVQDKSMLWTKVVALGALVICMAFDIFTGYLFYAQGGAMYPLAIAIVLDTLFSEIIIVFSLSLTLDLLPDVMRQLMVWKKSASDEWQKISGPKGTRQSKPKRGQPQRQRPQGMPQGADAAYMMGNRPMPGSNVIDPPQRR